MSSSSDADDEKGTAYFWKSTSIEPQISSLSLRHGIAKVALGSEHTLILTYGSQVFATGENSYGQLGFGDQTRLIETTRLGFFEGKDVIDIACGGHHSAAVCDNGELYCWGDSSNGQCGIGEDKSSFIPALVKFDPDLLPTTRPRSKQVDSEDIKLSHSASLERGKDHHLNLDVVQVSCGDAHTLALTSKGEVWSWGTGCQTGHGTGECIQTPQLVEGLVGRKVISVECGAYHSMALVKDPSTVPRIVPQKASKVMRGSSEKKLGKKLRRFSRSKESTKGKKAQSLLQGNEVSASSEIRRNSTTPTPPKTYLSYEPEPLSHTDVNESKEQSLGKANDMELSKINEKQKTELNNEQVENSSLNQTVNKTNEQSGDCTLSTTNLSSNSEHMAFGDNKTSTTDLTTSAKVDEPKASSTNEETSASSSKSDGQSYNSQRRTSDSIPIKRLSIHDNYFGISAHKNKTYLESLLSSSPEFSPPQSGFSHAHFENHNKDVFVTTDVSGHLRETSSLFESVEPTSLSSLGSISDSDEVTTPTTEEKPYSMSTYLGFGILTSRLRQEMDITKLTTAVYDSVTGMFMSPSSSTLPVPADKSAVHGTPCLECGVLGICVCNGKVLSQDKFIHEGYDTQVWTWGSGGCGQLGHGDTDDRLEPSCVDALSGTGIIKISAGTFHSLALTVYCQVFSWGDNSCGQLGHKKPISVKPRKVKCFSDVLIWDIACGSHYSMFVGDMALNRPDVYVCGRQPSEMPVIAAALKQLHDSKSPKDDSAIHANVKSKPRLTQSRSFDDVKDRSLGVRIELVRLIMFRKVGSVQSVHAQNEHCCCLAASDTTGILNELSELSSQERFFYYQLALIWQAVLVPVIQSDLWSMVLSQDTGSVLLPVIQGYLTLMKCVSSSVVSVNQIIQKSKPLDQLFDVCLSDEFIMAFERYSELVSNAVAFGVFMFFTNLAHDVGPQCKAVLRDLLEDADKDFISYMEAFQCVARVPMVRIQHYVDVTKKLLTIVPPDDPIYIKLQRVSNLWETLSWQDEKRYLLAEQTRLFWEDCPSKILETFKVPNRRLLRSSKTHTLYPSKSARFSSPTFVLFDDYFVNIQSNKNYQALPLNTLWAERMEDSEGLVHAIKITSPEETLLVCASCDTDRTDWLLAINKAIARVISKTTAYRLGKDAVNSVTGSLTAATAREAAYTFTQDSRYKGATYTGMWLTGKPHGRGEMSWLGGRHFSGEFQNGLHDGEGVMVFPCNPDNPAEKYEGQWMEGKMTGHGKMRYTNGDTYVGHWLDNMRHGHGTMKCGALSSSAASVYIGEWMVNKRHGYGSLDDVLRGEKYMGMWENDCRHGTGVVVTLEGLYIQGIFVQNKMMGSAQLICDDNTYFDGEFSSQFQLAGKGTLILPSGDSIDGAFNGQWGDGIKINGTFCKKESDSNSKTKYTVPDVKPVMSPDRKWVALFKQCRVALGCHGDQDADVTVVWKCISMALLSSHNRKLPRTEQEVMQELLNVNNEMEQTGKHSLHDFKAIQSYLTKAFEMSYHPLGQLVCGLVDVYRATYVGMGTHRRLLPHAVAEAKSIIHRLYNIVRLLFTDLPNEEYVHLDKDTLTGISNHHTEISTSSSALLHPIILPLLYPPLFTLYALHNERADSQYWERLLHLNWRSDLALLKYVGVNRPFWLSDEGEAEDSSEELSGEYREAHHYVTAIEALQQISTKLSPMEKLAVLKTTFEKINEEVHSYWKGEEKLMSLDDLFPVFQFVTIRARIPHMGSEIHFIDDMVDTHVHVGEQGHMFTTLKASFFQIQNEKG